MSFLYPLGLLGLIAIPILIIIYIIKNKYTEQVVTATYLWTLSERFLKRKNPINRITGIISLILQILAVICISFAIAQPVFTLPGAAHDYCFILDASGSMNIEQNGVTRFEEGRSRIKDVINSSVNGSAYTLVYAGESADIMFEGVDDKDRALLLLDEIEPRYCQSDTARALEAAQKYFNANPSVKTYLYTDKNYEQTENIELVNLAKRVNNYSVSQIKCVVTEGKLNVTGTVHSYSDENAELTLEMYVDGAETPAATAQIEVQANGSAEFAFQSDDTGYASVKVSMAADDAMPLDNQTVYYNVKAESAYKTLVVSDDPFRIQAVLGVYDSADIMTVKEYSAQPKTGYGLYVFDSYSPETVPGDGAVWFFNPQASSKNSGFTFQLEEELTVPAKLTYSTNTSTVIRKILENTEKRDIYVKKYVKCGLARNFYTVLAYNSLPIVFAGTNDYGNRQVVFAFSLKETDFSLMHDFVVLTENLLDFTFPPVIEKTSYFSGDIAEINVPANCDSLRIESPSGKVSYLDTGVDIAEHRLDEVGRYKFTLMTGSIAREVEVYSDLPMNERYVFVSEASFVVAGEAQNAGRDGVYNDLLYLFILLAVIFIADWMVYCYEQYQLR